MCGLVSIMNEDCIDLSKVPEMSVFQFGEQVESDCWLLRISVKKAAIALIYDNGSSTEYTPGFFGLRLYPSLNEDDPKSMSIDFFAPLSDILEKLANLDITKEHKIIIKAEGREANEKITRIYRLCDKPKVEKSEEYQGDFYTCSISCVIEIE